MPNETTDLTSNQNTAQLVDANHLLELLSNFCDQLQAGDVVPPHQQLMTRFNASERSVRWALDELRRQGKIIRRRGARTVIAEKVEGRGIVASSNKTNQTTVTAPQTRTVVAVTVPDYSSFDQAMELLVQQAKNDDLSVLCQLLHSTDLTSPFPQMAQEPLGFIVFRRELLPLAEKLHAAGNRVVAIATPYEGVTPQVPVVYGDHEYGGYLATKHLIDLGHRRIGFCAFGDYEITLRWQGHRRAIREANKRGLDIQDCTLDVQEVQTWKAEPAKAKAIFDTAVSPTGLAVWNDHEAVMVMGQLNRLGLRVPEDVSIVGYDNLREGQMLHPALTTVHSSMEQQLQASINLLLRDTAPTAPYQLVIQPTLVCRESSASVSSGA